MTFTAAQQEDGQYFDTNLCRPVFASRGTSAHFFGYFDICPWSHDGEALLSHRTDATGGYLDPADNVEIGFFQPNRSSDFQCIATTAACNWQQGSMLRWRGPSNDELVFNDWDESGYCARIVARSGGAIKRIGAPLYDITRDGALGLSISPERLWYTRRSYGYGRQPHDRWSGSVVNGDAVRVIDLETGDIRSLVEIRTLVDVHPLPSMKDALHWVDHPLFSPDGKWVAFFHRWLTPGGSFLTRLYSCGIDGTGLFIYPDGGMYSHLTWRDSETFVVFGRPPGRDIRTSQSNHSMRKRLVSAAMPLYRKLRGVGIVQKLRSRVFNDRYLEFKVGSDTPRVIAPKATVDGHPSFCPTLPSVMLTDTYPDERGFQHLLLANAKTGVPMILGSLPVPTGLNNSSPNRCDLHPRWSRDGRKICIDSMHTGVRQVYVIELHEATLEQLAES